MRELMVTAVITHTPAVEDAGPAGLPALRAPSRTAHVDLREMRLGNGAGYAP